MGLIRWTLDTCECIIDLDMPNETFSNSIQICQLHKNFRDQRLLTEILAHNRTFFDSRQNKTDLQKEEQIRLRANEKARIRALGAPIII